MNLQEKLKDDLKSALKGGDKTKTGVLRFLLAELQTKEKEKQGQGKPPELADEEVTTILQKEFKKRREAIELFRKGGREDLVASEEVELAVLAAYVPRQMDKAEVSVVIDKLIAGGLTDFNSVMKEAMKEMKGKVDGKLVGEVIKEKIK